MAPLPKRPEKTEAIPNGAFSYDDEGAVRGPYWDLKAGPGLSFDENGSLQVEGLPSEPPSAFIYGPNGLVGIGAGLEIDSSGQFSRSGPNYITCVPQYSDLPVTFPPYGCNTEVNTAGIENFTNAWFNCEGLTEFPCLDVSSGTNFREAWASCFSLTSFPPLDVSSGTNFSYAWAGCSSLTSFPALDVSSGTDFFSAWINCFNLTSFPLLNTSSGIDFSGAWGNCFSLTSFPLLNVSSGINFEYAWGSCSSLTSFPSLDVSSGTDFSSAWTNCSSLTSFPLLNVSSGENFQYTWGNCFSLTSFPLLNVSSGTDFSFAWSDCTSLTTFPAGMFDTCTATEFTGAWQNCALSQQSVDNILVSLDTAGQTNGFVHLDGGASSSPGSAGLAALASLEAKGWTVSVNAD